MASNKIPFHNYSALVELLTDAADGALAHGDTVGLKANDGPTLTAALHALVGTPAGPNNTPPALPGTKALWNAALAAKSAKSAALRTAISNGRALALACVGTLKPRLGQKWNAAWTEAGFPAGSLEVPRNPEVLLQQLAAYYTAHSAHETPDLTPTISCTAAACLAAATAITTADTASNQSNTTAGLTKAAHDETQRAARIRLTALREELTPLLGPEDERWYLFGFERPADPETPEVPANVVATPGGPGMLFVDWDNARRAETYRITLESGVVIVASKIVEESEAAFTGLASGQTLTIKITARNDAGGESQPSAPTAITVP